MGRRALRSPNNPEQADRWFTEWRKTIPFSTEALAHALEQELAEFPGTGTHPGYLQKRIEEVRAGGRFSVREYTRYMLPRLIHHCAICGRRALYRVGSEGRCTTHKHQETVSSLERRKRLDARSASIGETQRQRDAHDLKLASFKATLRSLAQRRK